MKCQKHSSCDALHIIWQMREEGLGIKGEVNLRRVSKITTSNQQFKLSKEAERELSAPGLGSEVYLWKPQQQDKDLTAGNSN